MMQELLFFSLSDSISRLVRHQGLPCYWPPLPQAPPTVGKEAGPVATAEELEERMETIIEANDVLLERVVSPCPD